MILRILKWQWVGDDKSHVNMAIILQHVLLPFSAETWDVSLIWALMLSMLPSLITLSFAVILVIKSKHERDLLADGLVITDLNNEVNKPIASSFIQINVIMRTDFSHNDYFAGYIHRQIYMCQDVFMWSARQFWIRIACRWFEERQHTRHFNKYNYNYMTIIIVFTTNIIEIENYCTIKFWS